MQFSKISVSIPLHKLENVLLYPGEIKGEDVLLKLRHCWSHYFCASQIIMWN